MRFALADGVPLAGADEGAGATAMKPSTADESVVGGGSAATLGLRFIGGGRFFEPPGAGLLAAGARRVGTGSGSDGDGGLETSSCSALKLRFERRGRLMVVQCTKGMWREIRKKRTRKMVGVALATEWGVGRGEDGEERSGRDKSETE